MAELEDNMCPAQSPDINPTELFWDEMAHQLHSRRPQPASVSDLTKRQNTPPQPNMLQNLL